MKTFFLILVLNLVGLFAHAQGLYFYPLSPCRLIDTRSGSNLPFKNGKTRTYKVTGLCKIPNCAKSLSVNMAVVVGDPTGTQGFVTIYPNNIPRPEVSTMNVANNIYNNTAIANGAIVPIGGAPNEIAIYTKIASPTHGFHIVLDTNGYFAETGCFPLQP